MTGGNSKDLSREEWAERATARFKERLGDGWSDETINGLVETLVDAYYKDCPEDPEESVDEELSCWD